ncbi:hypothetical protein J0910_25190 [Nocardiopsis sp. CNT-189]|uniref:hypothetical protein n=1 Tax=Nocardiopsis oceanisediminis TaxID=2816862 RepID=UPI003B341A09
MIGTAGGTALESTALKAAGAETEAESGGRGRGLGPLPVAGALLVAAVAAVWAATGSAAPSEERIAVEVTARTNGATGTVIEGYRAEDGGITLVYAARDCTGIGPVRVSEDSATVRVSVTEVYSEAGLADCAGGITPAAGGAAGRGTGHAGLESPLGSREVIDAAGRPVPECTPLTCALR